MELKRAGQKACLAILAFIFLASISGLKARALAPCVNSYDEADPFGECLTSACTVSCAGGVGFGPGIKQAKFGETQGSEVCFLSALQGQQVPLFGISCPLATQRQFRIAPGEGRVTPDDRPINTHQAPWSARERRS
jgi:hypothetical protein